MTTKRKIEILKEMLEVIQGNHLIGLCSALCWVKFPDTVKLKQVGIKRPLLSYLRLNGSYWFPRNEKGQQQRIKLLTATIKRLEKKL